VAEEFGFQQVARNRGGIDGDEGGVLARTVAVQGTRHQLLAGAGLTVDQDCGVRLAEPADGAEDFLQRGALAQNLGHRAGFHVCTILVRRLGDGPPNQFHGLVDVKGFGQVFKGAALEGRHRRIEVGIGGHDDHRQFRKMLLDVAQQFQAALARHADVRDQYLRPLAAIERGQRFVGRAEGLGGDFLAAECLFQHPADGTVIVDDPDGIHQSSFFFSFDITPAFAGISLH
jgi:hypothetical protein